MNIEENYENLAKAKTSLDKIIEMLTLDTATKARLNNVSSRIEMTLIDLEKEENK